MQCSSLGSRCEHFSQANATNPHKWQVNIGSDNGLVPSGNKPLPEPMLTCIYDAMWCHQATMIWKPENYHACLDINSLRPSDAHMRQ